jgi:hypothetical protein
MSYYEAFLADVREALAREPGFPAALRFLASVVASEPERLQPGWVWTTLASPEALAADSAATWLVRGRFDRAEHRYAEAGQDFVEYRRAGGDPGLALLEIARTEAADSAPDAAAAAYLTGLDSVGPAGRRAYRLDLQWIADSAELADFDTTPDSALRAWATRFFDKRDAADVRDAGERLREQLRRWGYVHQHFALAHPASSSAWGHGWFRNFLPCYGSDSTTFEQFGGGEPVDTADPRHRERILDDRAVIYMRHGSPLRDIYSVAGTDQLREGYPDRPGIRRDGGPIGAGSPGDLLGPGDADEVWLYSIAGVPRTYQFVGSEQLGQQAPTTLLWFPEDTWLLEQRGVLDPASARLASIALTSSPTAGLLCLVSAQRAEARSRADVAVAATTDGFPPAYAHPILAAVQANAIADSTGMGGHLVIAYAISPNGLEPEHRNGGVVYPLTLRITAVDSTGAVTRLSGDASVTRPAPLRPDQLLSGLIQVPVGRGVWRAGLRIEVPGADRGTALSIPGLRVGADAPLDVSTLFLGAPGNALTWRGPRDTAAVTPETGYASGSSVDLFYQVSGVTAGTPFRTTVEIYRHANDRIGSRVVRLGFEDQAPGPVAPLHRTIDLSRLGTGDYLLVVTVTAADGKTPVRRERAFAIRKP